MKKIFKNPIYFFLVNVSIVLVAFLFFAPQYNLLHLINAFSYITFVYFIVFLFMFIKQGGFFDAITLSFRKFNQVMFRQNDPLDEDEEKPLPSENVNLARYQSIRNQALALLALLVILMIIYYLV